MRNLKKMLSLVMALAMVASFMVVGASAQFPDDKDIKNKDAVETLVSLGVIKGRDTGVFDPTGIVTRAEMAKMICVAMNGGKDPNLTGVGSFPDTKNHWAAGYIDYCKNMGYVAGNPDGKFYPDKTVTGTEASKMILTILGYDAVTENFGNNANWEMNINVTASTKGLYDNVTMLPSQGLTRDNAAQMLWDGLQTPMVKYTFLGVVNGNSIAKAEDLAMPGGSLVEKKFDMLTKYGYMDGVSFNEDKDTYTYTFNNGGSWNLPVIATDYIGMSIKSTKDYSDLYGMQVKVLYKNDNDKKVYGVYASDSTVLFDGVCSDVTLPAAADTSVKADSTSYKLDGAANTIFVIDYIAGSTTYKLDNAANYTAGEYSFKLVDTDDNGKANLAIRTPFIVKEVTFVGKDSITAGNGYDFEDHSIVEGLVKGDFVKITAPANNVYGGTKNVITKIETISGTAEAIKNDRSVKIDGTWYKPASSFSETLTVGESYDLAVNGKFVYASTKTSNAASAKDVVYVAASENAGTISASKTKVYFTDGTSSIVNVTKLNGSTIASGANVPAQNLYTYKVKGGDYELTAITSSNLAGFDGFTTTAQNGRFLSASTDRFAASGLYLADDAVVVVDSNYTPVPGESRDTKTVTGKVVKGWGTDYASNVSLALYTTVNGLKTAQVVVLGATTGVTPPSGGSTNYGYVTSTPVRVKSGDDTYAQYTLWTGETEITVLDAEDDLRAIAKGMIITYADLGGDKIESTVSAVGLTPVAITGYGTKNVQMVDANGALVADYKLTDSTTQLYVNSKDSKGVASSGITEANVLPNGGRVLNAWYVRGTSPDVDLLVIDTNNDIDGLANTIGTGAAGSWMQAAGSTANVAAANVTLDKTYAVEGDTVVISLKVSTAVGGADVTVTVTPLGQPAFTMTLPANSAVGTVVTAKYVVVGTTSVNIPFTMTIS